MANYPWSDSYSFALNGCLPCCTSEPVTILCRSKSGSIDVPRDDLYQNDIPCESPPLLNTGSFSFIQDDIFGVNVVGSPNYNAPNLPVVQATVSFTATFYRGPESCSSASDDSTCVDGAYDTMFSISSVSVAFDDGDTVLYSALAVKPASWGGAAAVDGGPVNVGYCFSGEQAISVPAINASYYEPNLGITYYSGYGTNTMGTWPDLCGLCLVSSGVLESELATIQSTGDWTDPGECDITITVGEDSTSYAISQWKAQMTGLTASTEYSLKIYYDKMVEGEWVTGSYLEVIFTATASNEETDWIDVVSELFVMGSTRIRLVNATVEENAPPPPP